jgi:N4-gp56 family major capsid protein
MALNTNVTNSSNLNSAVATYYDKQFLDWLKADLFFDQMAQKKKLPKNSGTVVQFQRYDVFAANTSALTEATVPSGLAMTSTTITATPLQYGDYIALSDRIMVEAIDPIIENAQELLAYRAALSMDTIIRNTLHNAVTNQFAAAAANEAATSAVMTASELRIAVRTLKSAKVKPFAGGEFKAIIDPHQSYDLMSETNVGGFLDVTKYTSSDGALRGEIGKLWGVRIMESPNIQNGTGSGSVTTYRAFVFGQGAYGIVDVESMGLKTIRKPLGSAGSGDPLDQIATVGYKFSHVTKVLDANRAIEVYTCAS